jgi:hypothetical protein
MKHNVDVHTCIGEVVRLKQKLSSRGSVQPASVTGVKTQNANNE